MKEPALLGSFLLSVRGVIHEVFHNVVSSLHVSHRSPHALGLQATPEHLPPLSRHASFPVNTHSFSGARLGRHHPISHSMSLPKFIPQLTTLVSSSPSDHGLLGRQEVLPVACCLYWRCHSDEGAKRSARAGDMGKWSSRCCY